MKISTWASALAFLAAVLASAGCSSERGTNASGDPASNDPSLQTVDLDDPHGGFLAADEEPAFGDEGLVEATLADEEVADGYAGLDPNERAWARNIENRRHIIYSVKVLWGNLDTRDASTIEMPQELTEPVTWDGSLRIRGGAIRVLQLIAFERPEDHLGDPRPDPGTLSWASVTHGDFDGLHVLLVFRAGSNVTPAEAPDDTLRLQAGPLGEVVYPIAELEDLSVILDVPDSHEKVSLTAVRVETAARVRGFIAGRWGWAEGDSVGRFAGRWASADGRTTGHLRGHYGENSQGEQVFFGKYIDDQGRFQGFLRGTYAILRRVGNPDDPAGDPKDYEVGEFHGRWEDERGRLLGDLHGTWSRVGRRPGVFSGSWRGMGIAP